eukprot:g24429.t1
MDSISKEGLHNGWSNTIDFRPAYSRLRKHLTLDGCGRDMNDNVEAQNSMSLNISPGCETDISIGAYKHQLATKRHDQYSLISIHKDKESHQFDWDNTWDRPNRDKHGEFLEA